MRDRRVGDSAFRWGERDPLILVLLELTRRTDFCSGGAYGRIRSAGTRSVR